MTTSAVPKKGDGPMKKSRFSEEPIAYAPRGAEQDESETVEGPTVVKLGWRLTVSSLTGLFREADPK